MVINRTLKYFVVLACCCFFALHAWAQDDTFDFPPGEEGVEEMLTFILEASNKERKALSAWLRPDLESCEAVFDDRIASKVYKYQKRLKREVNLVIRPLLKDQTEYLLWGANQEAIASYSSTDARSFPGGYRELADYMNPNYEFFRFKFVQPGRKLGSAYDVLVYVNGKWCMIHRPWVVILP